MNKACYVSYPSDVLPVLRSGGWIAERPKKLLRYALIKKDGKHPGIFVGYIRPVDFRHLQRLYRLDPCNRPNNHTLYFLRESSNE